MFICSLPFESFLLLSSGFDSSTLGETGTTFSSSLFDVSVGLFSVFGSSFTSVGGSTALGSSFGFSLGFSCVPFSTFSVLSLLLSVCFSSFLLSLQNMNFCSVHSMKIILQSY